MFSNRINVDSGFVVVLQILYNTYKANNLADEISTFTDWTHNVENISLVSGSRLCELDMMVGTVHGRSDQLRH